LLVLAVALRLVALAIPAVAHPDEVFQYLEPAHRLVFGYGVTTWEWRYGMRGWLIPLIVAGPMALGGAIAPGSAAYLVLPKLLMVTVSLSPILAGFALGHRLSRDHGLAAAAAAAIWYEGVYYAPHPLSETLSLAAILPAAAFLLAPERWDARRLATAGALLGLAASLRFQYLPAIAVLALCALGRSWRAWPPLLVGGIAGLLPSAIADAAMGQVPYAWVVENVRLNLVANQAMRFGTSSIAGFLYDSRARWALWIVPALVFGAKGARRYPALAWTAAANLAFHLALAHKEYRFLLLSSTILTLLAAIGTVDMIRAIAARDGAERARERARLFAACWLFASLSLALGGFAGQWTRFRAQLDPAIALRSDPALCGLAIYRNDYSMTGAYTYLHRPVPMLDFDDEDAGDPVKALRGEAGRIDAILAAPARARELPAGFVPLRCGGPDDAPMCLYRRPGGCDPSPSRYAIGRTLARIAL
jgi:hypothetical protein